VEYFCDFTFYFLPAITKKTAPAWAGAASRLRERLVFPRRGKKRRFSALTDRVQQRRFRESEEKKRVAKSGSLLLSWIHQCADF
jgi:hypothetical protein